MPSTNSFEDQTRDIASRASQMRDALFNDLADSSGSFTNACAKIDDVAKRKIPNSVYESAGDHAGMIFGAHARSYLDYYARHGRHPSDEILASAHQAVENVMHFCSKTPAQRAGLGVGVVLESADMMSTTDGIMMRDRLVSLVLPVLLQSITSNMVTLTPGQFNQAEFFRVRRVAKSTFGDLKSGDPIDYKYNGRYGVMDQVFKAGTGDGSATEFSLNTTTSFGKLYPLKKRRIKIFHDHDVVGTDSETGAIAGTFINNAKAPVVVSGSVNYQAGTVNLKFSVPPAAGVEIHIGYDVDIERDPTLIPIIDHEMDSRTLFPHESAIAGNATLQALWALRRELQLDIENMTMAGMRNILTADKDRKILRDLYFYARGTHEWVFDGPESLTLREHYETLNAVLLAIDTQLMNSTGVSGLVGIVAGTDVVNIFRYLPAPYFTPAPGYRQLAQPHYVGRVFGQWDLYCDPSNDSHSALCYAKGPDHGQTGYVAGDAIPAITFRHPILGDLMSKGTMWELAYRDLQPFDGRNYLTTLKIISGSAA